jgi:hypothetical protein
MGLLYFLLSFLEGPVDLQRYSGGEPILGKTGYVVLKLAMAITVILFQRGFFIAAGIFKNYVLRIACIAFATAMVGIYMYDVASVFQPLLNTNLYLIASSIPLGAIAIMYGFALYQLRPQLGRLALMAACFEVISGCFFLTGVLGFIGVFTHIPAELLEILLLVRINETGKSASVNSR